MAIAMTNDAPALEPTCHASCDLRKEWEQSCAKAMGFNSDAPPYADDNAQPVIHILNLMDDGDADTTMSEASNSTTEDYWMDNANQIAASITQMADMIVKNQRAYVTGDLTDEEASVLESTVLSFSATAANQIDALRGAMDQYQSPDYVHHCSGIVASLMLRLREQVANPMASLQKQRTRTAMTIYQQPLSCRLVIREQSADRETDGTVWDQLVEDDEGASLEQRFRPQHAAPSMSTDFMATYASNEDEIMSYLQRPPSLFQQKTQQETKIEESAKQPPTKQLKFSAKTKKVHEERLMYHQQQEDVRLQEETQQELQKEAVLLEASLQNDLDSVYQVEQRMTEITALLSQFSTLVSEQQEEIVTIHDTARSSKENVSKGQESLVDAKERTKRSKHYMATVVWSVALILLFFNYVTP